MLITVHPCFHWIGYHMSTGFLQEGRQVIGIDRMDASLSEHLYMYVGRNSNFQHFYSKEDKERHTQPTDDELFIEYADQYLIVERKHEDRIFVQVELPHLYGEWMDVSRKGIEQEEELLEWVRASKAVYISDFLNEFIPYVLSLKEERQPKPFEDLCSPEDQNKRVESVWKAYQTMRKLYL
ncbi:MAG: hypothetical protein WAM07_09140 [Halobacillus sp.]|uniref:hypothetical protein n=1 Tax=Halobacillus sp. TaxID=56800 RepID=UPI003BB1A842